ncbi:lantibiotic dehydratase [Streptomyces sp. ISL-44]|nr:lantibiotic dehydratase [Streptomyces sp. ISL-44]
MANRDPGGDHGHRQSGRAAAVTAAADLGELLAAIQDWERQPAGTGAAAFPVLAYHARRITGFETATPLQVDTALPLAACDVSRKVADEAVRAAELLLRLTPLPFGLPQISAYRRAFEVRYGTDRDVSVLELLDPVTGLGSPSRPPPVIPAKPLRHGLCPITRRHRRRRLPPGREPQRRCRSSRTQPRPLRRHAHGCRSRPRRHRRRRTSR